MLTSLGAAGLLGILGTLAAVLYTVVLAFGGAPGSALSILGNRYGNRGLIRAGKALSFVAESYLLLAFAALVVRFVEAFLVARPYAPAWPLWLVGWYLATAPVLFGGRGAPGAAGRQAADTAFAVELPVAALGFWVFVLWRGVLHWGWGWIPPLRF